MPNETVEMDEETLDAFLTSGGTGVLSVSTASDKPPYSLPVSYGYDSVGRALYFRLGFESNSEKAAFISDGRPVSFITTDLDSDHWRSAIASGTLDAIEETAIGSEAEQGLTRVDIPLVDMFDHPTQAVSFRFFRLDPESLTGREELPR